MSSFKQAHLTAACVAVQEDLARLCREMAAQSAAADKAAADAASAADRRVADQRVRFWTAATAQCFSGVQEPL